MHRTVIMIGCGNMGSALLAKWQTLDTVSFTVVDPGLDQPPAGTHWVRSVDELPSDLQFDALLIAVKPQLIGRAIPPAAQHLKEQGCVISIAAGTSASTLSQASTSSAVIRLMPNMPARVGRGISGLYASATCTDDHKSLADELAQLTGTALWLDHEDRIDAVTAIAGSGPGYVYEFARTYQNAVHALGFEPEQARQLVMETIAGCMALAEQDDATFETLRNAIMSPGGTTAAGVSALNPKTALDNQLINAVSAAYERACELRD